MSKSKSQTLDLTLPGIYQDLTPVYRVALVRERSGPTPHVPDPDAAEPILRAYLGDADREMFIVLMLNSKNYAIGINTVSMGNLVCTVVSPAEVFKPAILSNAAGLIVAHNHPSGDPTPSPEDITLTRKLHDAGKLLDIPILDHIIIGEPGRWTSLSRQGYLS